MPFGIIHNEILNKRALAQVPLNSIMHTTLGIPLDILIHVSLMGWSLNVLYVSDITMGNAS